MLLCKRKPAQIIFWAGRNFYGVVANVMDDNIVVSEF